MSRFRYQHLGLGGTFDHLHKGHEHFIRFAANLAQKISIGVTHDSLTKNKAFSQTIQPYKTRAKAISKFCSQNNINFEIIQISDIYGPTLTDKSIQALCVTTETVSGAEKINQARAASGLKELPVHICDLVNDDSGEELHSERIREGVVSRQGRIYLDVLAGKDKKITLAQRQFFQEPLGKIIEIENATPNSKAPVCLVGDVTLNQWLTRLLPFDLAVFDLHTERDQHNFQNFNSINGHLTAKNPAGTITQNLVKTLKKALLNQHKYVQVDGEEDLATIALVLLLPLYSTIYYGQPGQGLVKTQVTEQLKSRVADVLAS